MLVIKKAQTLIINILLNKFIYKLFEGPQLKK